MEQDDYQYNYGSRDEQSIGSGYFFLIRGDGQTQQNRCPYETMPYIGVLHFVGVASGLTPTYSGNSFTASYDESMDSIPTNFHSTINCRLFGSTSAAFGPVLSHNFKQIDLTLPKIHHEDHCQSFSCCSRWSIHHQDY